MNNKHMLFLIATVVATGGLLFGFDTGVISGAILFLQADWELGDNDVAWITAAGLVGAILGAAGCGRLADVFGRKKIIGVSAVIFASGALWSAGASGWISLFFSRLFLGVAIGITSFAVPLYIAEIAPAKSRGRFVSMFQLMVTAGILLSYLSDRLWADESDPECWRLMFCTGVVPAIVLLAGMFFMPETPGWLMSQSRREACRKVLLNLEPETGVDTRLRQMEQDVPPGRNQAAGWKYLMQPGLRKPLMIAVCLMFFQQFIGINTVIYYSPKIFLMAGFENTLSALWASVGIGAVNLVFTVISLYLVDRIGRRKLFFTGLAGIVVSLVCLSFCFVFAVRLDATGRWLMVGFMLAYVAFFALSIGPLGWLVVSEIFPQPVRGLGTSIGSLSVWIFNGIVTFTFFGMVEVFSIPDIGPITGAATSSNPAGAFFFYAAIAALALVWGYFFLPETKGVPLEEIEKMWKIGRKPADNE